MLVLAFQNSLATNALKILVAKQPYQLLSAFGLVLNGLLYTETDARLKLSTDAT